MNSRARHTGRFWRNVRGSETLRIRVDLAGANASKTAETPVLAVWEVLEAHSAAISIVSSRAFVVVVPRGALL
jgi:hypothetical protein